MAVVAPTSASADWPERQVKKSSFGPAELDALVEKTFASSKTAPAKPVGDEEFVRRAFLDVTGKLPTPEQVLTFVRSKEKDKRARLIDYLLASPDYATNWARYWRDVIRYRATNENVGLAAILDAADYFYATTGRQVTYEYVLLRDLNDRPEHAAALARLLRGRQAHVNLIPFNDVAGLPYRRPLPQAIDDFVGVLKRARISVKVRKTKGSDVEAACGQRPPLPDWLADLNERSERVTTLPVDQGSVERHILSASRAAREGAAA